MEKLISIQNFHMYYSIRNGFVKAVNGIDLDIFRGESVGLAGESGCGKSSLSMSFLQLLPSNAKVNSGHLYYLEKGEKRDLPFLSEDQLRKIRGAKISMIFQAAMNSFNPVYKVGDQIVEAIQVHARLSRKQARKKVEKLFTQVGMEPQRAWQYPLEYSGGMKQRAAIALALCCNPELIIADEPTTALDVIVQYKILKELKSIQKELGMSILYISHDIGIIAEVSERIAVMYAGKIVEIGNTQEIIQSPRHPYTLGLLHAFPTITGEKKPLEGIDGEPADLSNLPQGCAFYPRCTFRKDICRNTPPGIISIQPTHQIQCHTLHC